VLQIVLLAGKFILLIILYMFIYRVIRSSTQEFRLSAAAGGRPSGVGGPNLGHAEGRHVGAAVEWTLVVARSPRLKRGEVFVFPPGSRAVVGRDPDMDISLDDTFVSSKHALFEVIGGVLRVEDLHSTNGTLVNGRDIAGIRDLQAGDRIEIGDTVFEVEVR
jgi:hypothetical protein